MATYQIIFDGVDGAAYERDYPTLDDARNGAIVLLGAHLQAHPEFAWQKQWRVDLRDAAGRLVLHVIVATVDAPPAINFQSYQG